MDWFAKFAAQCLGNLAVYWQQSLNAAYVVAVCYSRFVAVIAKAARLAADSTAGFTAPCAVFVGFWRSLHQCCESVPAPR